MADRRTLRMTFNENAALYDRARPHYPAGIFNDLDALAGTGPGCRVLEIGCGTGQATAPLAARGCEVVAVELGAEMAEVARRNLKGFPSVEVVNGAFEEWSLPDEPFDMVFAATAFNWVDPEVRVAKAADALRPGGALATVATHHVAGGTEAFFVEVQDCYERYDPETPEGLRLPAAYEVPRDTEVDRSGLFGTAIFRRHELDLSYTTSEYLDVLRTYSGHRALPSGTLAELLDCIGRLIDDRFRGRITKRYMFELRLAYRNRT
ncbi:class I SAM-dependent methyltransferase [Actinomadura rudentiformis]|uniref:Class I SAM-dependent methyltransferase n=1 Tax=Actinomadura rudentiformis TaxID=359158 RepID=A0A6H9YXX0_9ACTN|nr:class I SAM-dependent methyltransferase [Actinomadura rudentiformis]KAB2351363.1 class I SAM-dependent methyltransferase [Actinomadura rudentiformis]